MSEVLKGILVAGVILFIVDRLWKYKQITQREREDTDDQKQRWI